ncbi:Acetoacetyl-CoA synthetase [Ceratocystis lukuohia]|uniref:Acetoacetyl-CoA synthetase n=1 Tax=Ceratocystis lukuohia TaxID=2019550 RepID=A0ABR4MMN3_9PEZI
MVVAIPKKLWEHPNPKSTKMYRLMMHLNKCEGLNLQANLLTQTFQDLHTYSITQRNTFYLHMFKFLGILYTGTLATAVDESIPISAVPTWFPGVFLNFAENMLYSAGPTSADSQSCLASQRSTSCKDDGEIAVTACREAGSVVEHITWKELRARAAKMADMGIASIMQRVSLIDPKFIFYDDAAIYNGKVVELRENIAAVLEEVTKTSAPLCPSFVSIVAIPRFVIARPVCSSKHVTSLEKFLAIPSSTPEFERVGFSEPATIYFSSGTTGMPKAIVQTVGGIALNMLKEATLHEHQDENDVSLQYTTTGWIMYLAAVAPLLYGARVVLYDGSPLHPDPRIFISLLSKFKATKLGTSPRFLYELAKNNIRPRDIADLSLLKHVTSTGMVLSEDLFNWFYDEGFPRHTHLANISGGTEIAGCFGRENPLTPVYVGGTQGPTLGVAVGVYSLSEPLSSDGTALVGKPIEDGSPGELVATKAFPNMPCFLWGDGPVSPTTKFPLSSPGPKYISTYFSRYKDAWAHGDFCTIHPVTGNINFLGRADGVLNPSGVRFGSADIYAVIERNFSDRIADSLCVGRRRLGDPDEKVMLFVLMNSGCAFNEGLVIDIKQQIAKQLSKRHVPTFVFPTPAIPTTINLKKVELLVKQIVSGQQVKPSATLLNPESLAYYYQFARVEEKFKGKL